MKRNRKAQIRCFISYLLVLCMLWEYVPITAFAKETEGTTQNSAVEHKLYEGNNWDISKEFIMPGEEFYIVPKYEEPQYGKLTAGAMEEGVSLMLSNAAILLDGSSEARWYTNKLVRSQADTPGIVASRSNTYNIIKMAKDNGDLDPVIGNIKPDDIDNQTALLNALQGQSSVNAGYVNHTNTPIVLEQVRGSSTIDEGKIYGGENGDTLIISACSTQRSGCTIRFYEPYYTLTYEKLLPGEEVGLPDRYYVQNAQQEIVLPNLVRPGYHFKEWTGGLFFADKNNVEGNTVYSFDGKKLLNAGYNWGDETLSPTFQYGYTVTFNTNGGTIDGRENPTYEFSKDDDIFFDIGAYVPVREGCTFLGWCFKPSAYYDSLIEDTSNYQWMSNASGSSSYDMQLYAKWAEETDEELEKKGYRFVENTGELKIITTQGMNNWVNLCEENDEYKAKVKSLVLTGDVTEVSTVFKGYPSLGKVTLSDKINTIYNYAFSNCPNLYEVIFEKSDTKNRLFVGDSAFDGCHDRLVIRVQTSVINQFKESYMPQYADRITDVQKKAIELIEINGVTTDFKVGDKPVFTAKVPENAPYYIDYESWSGSDEFAIFSSDYWNNTSVERGWCKGFISEFKENTSYNYDLYIKLTQEGANAGYYFDKEKTKLSINGQTRNLSSDMIGIDSAPYDDTATFGTVLTIKPIKPDPCEKGHTSKETVTQATENSDGKIETKCSVCGEVLSTKTIPKASDISLSATSYTYNGKVKKPTVTVKDSTGKNLSSEDYTVSYGKGLKNVGNYDVTITFKGNYSGTVKKTFTIKPKATSISELTAGEKKFTVKWKKQTTQTTGYQIQYSTSSNFKNKKTVTVSKNKTTSKTVSKLKAKKKYYVRVRTYKTVKSNGKSTKIYSSWSKARTVKVK